MDAAPSRCREISCMPERCDLRIRAAEKNFRLLRHSREHWRNLRQLSTTDETQDSATHGVRCGFARLTAGAKPSILEHLKRPLHPSCWPLAVPSRTSDQGAV